MLRPKIFSTQQSPQSIRVTLPATEIIFSSGTSRLLSMKTSMKFFFRAINRVRHALQSFQLVSNFFLRSLVRVDVNDFAIISINPHDLARHGNNFFVRNFAAPVHEDLDEIFFPRDKPRPSRPPKFSARQQFFSAQSRPRRRKRLCNRGVRF